MYEADKQAPTTMQFIRSSFNSDRFHFFYFCLFAKQICTYRTIQLLTYRIFFRVCQLEHKNIKDKHTSLSTVWETLNFVLELCHRFEVIMLLNMTFIFLIFFVKTVCFLIVRWITLTFFETTFLVLFQVLILQLKLFSVFKKNTTNRRMVSLHYN